MATPTLGMLEKVELRDIWKTEAQDFTPWLADEPHLKLLGDTIGIELELEAQEKEVGPFRADILCKDTANDSWVLVENQLELTDHRHLGQILTYAAGLNAVTIVWVAERFTDEHQATIEWLNEITGGDINFFGLEIELWRIADSPIAPKFNIVAKPNEWTKGGGIVKAPTTLSNVKRLQQEFWTAFRKHVLSQRTIIKPQKPRPQHWMNIAIGRSKFHMSAFIHTREKQIGIDLWIKGANHIAHFKLLEEERETIESELGRQLVWNELPDKKSSYIRNVQPGVDPCNRDGWPEAVDRLCQMAEAMHKAFSERVKALDVGDYQPEDETE